MRTEKAHNIRRLFLLMALAGMLASHSPGCGGNSSGEGATPETGGRGQGGKEGNGGMGGAGNSGAADTSGGGGGSTSGASGTAGSSGKVGTTERGGAMGRGGETARGGATEGAGGSAASPTDAAAAAVDASQSGQYVVAMLQSTKANAADLTAADVAELVSNAVTQAGGLDFVRDGQTVVIKPNLVSAYTDHYRMKAAAQTVNGIATDWRVVKAVADLVRAKVGSTGKILVMEGSTMSTATAYSMLGYTKENIGSVDEFVALEGSSCGDRTTTELVQKAGRSGTQYWISKRYVEADVVISVPTMKTHWKAGITGGVKNLGIGVTPIGQFSGPMDAAPSSDCTRGQTAGTNSIDHSSPLSLGSFIRDYYSVRPADFVVMDALQGLEHGPSPAFEPKGDAGYWDYEPCKKNMRLILAGRNAVAVDTVEALVMKCDPKKVPHLTQLEADGLGTTDVSKITVIGSQIADVAKPFASTRTDICPGT